MNKSIMGDSPALASTVVGQHSTGCQQHFRLSLMALACLSALQASPACADSFTGLGHLPGSIISSAANAVSADGSVIVGITEMESGDFHAYRWTASGGMTELAPAYTWSQATGVSADGSVIIGNYDTDGDGIHEAFRWSSSGFVTFATPLPLYDITEAWGVSGDGSTVVGDIRNHSFGQQQAIAWNGGVSTPLGFLPSHDRSAAYSTSHDGSVIVGSSWSLLGGVTEAFRYTQAGGMVGLGQLDGGSFSVARAVSADGKVVVGDASTSIGKSKAFRWTATDGMVDLGYLPGGFGAGAAGVSADGSVVVGYAFGGGPNQAFRWTQATGMKSVSGLLAEGGVNLGTWQLEVANAVSADGTTIVGYGLDPNGFTAPFIARIGSPAGGSSALVSVADFNQSVASLGATSHLPAEIARVAVRNEVPGLSGLTGFSAAPVYQHISGSRGDLGGAALTWRQPGVALAGQVGHLNAATSGLHDGGRGDYRGWWLGAAASLGLGELLNQPAIDGLELDAAIRTGRYDTDINRNYLNGITVESARGNTDTRDLTALARVGWRFAVADTVHLIPHLQVLHSRTHVDGYDETSGTLAGRVSSQKRSNLETSAGVTAAWQVRPDLELRGRYSLNHLRDNTGAPVSVTVAGLGTFGAGGTQYDSNWHEFGAGADWAITEKIRLNASAIRTAGSNYPENWALGVAVNFGL